MMLIYSQLNGVLVPITSPVDKKKYSCWLPPSWTDDEDVDSSVEVPSIVELLEPLSLSCLYRVKFFARIETNYFENNN